MSSSTIMEATELTVALVGAAGSSPAEAGAQALGQIAQSLAAHGAQALDFAEPDDALRALARFPRIDAVVVRYDGATGEAEAVTRLIAGLRARNHLVPIFLACEPSGGAGLPVTAREEIEEYIWLFEDSPDFIAGRIEAAAKRYFRRLLPPMFGAMIDFSETFEYSWHTPGHEGGVAFGKSPVGSIYRRFFGEQMLRSDLSISVGALGSLLDHSGPIGAAEAHAAKVFGADRTYFVTNGTSMSNCVVMTGSATSDDTVLIDRNCHKSLEHGAILAHARPVWMVPSRNAYGIIGPIPAQSFAPEALNTAIAAAPLPLAGRAPVLATITNSTYDGICYDVGRVERDLGAVVARLHFDEAWYGYARFNPIYAGRFAMRDGARDAGAPTLFATQSTHKLLAALSQASMIHVREGRSPFAHARFNEAYMLFASTSPFYPIIASCDVATKMMEGAFGPTLTGEAIGEAVAFRQEMVRLGRELDGWWFGMWQPDTVPDAAGKPVSFDKADPVRLATDAVCWQLDPGEDWHGFADLEPGYAMLDPIKVTVLSPGVNADGSLTPQGIPMAPVVAFLAEQGIVNEKSDDYSVLFLFSMGTTRGKWQTLVSAFMAFKTAYDGGATLDETLPTLVAAYPERYSGMTLRALCDEMHAAKRDSDQLRKMDAAFSRLPEGVLRPDEAFGKLVHGEVDKVGLSEAQGRIMSVGIVPYPPGIPMLMGGEWAGTLDGPFLGYLQALEAFDRQFPGFEHDIHGIESENGNYRLYAVRE